MAHYRPTTWPNGLDIHRKHSPLFREMMIRNISKEVEKLTKLETKAEKLARPEDVVEANRIVWIHERQRNGEIVTEEANDSAGYVTSDGGGASGSSTTGAGADAIMTDALLDSALPDADPSELTLDPALLDTPMPSPASLDPDLQDTNIPQLDLPEPAFTNSPMPDPSPLEAALEDSDVLQLAFSEPAFTDTPVPGPSPLEAALEDSDVLQLTFSEPAFTNPPVPGLSRLEAALQNSDTTQLALQRAVLEEDQPLLSFPGPADLGLPEDHIPTASNQLAHIPTEDIDHDSENDILYTIYGNEWGGMSPGIRLEPRLVGTVQQWERWILFNAPVIVKKLLFTTTMARFLAKVKSVRRSHYEIRVNVQRHLALPATSDDTVGDEDISTESIWISFDSDVTGREVAASLAHTQFPVTLEAIVHLKSELLTFYFALGTLDKIRRAIEKKHRDRMGRAKIAVDPTRRLLSRGLGSSLRYSISVDEEWPEGEWGMPYIELPRPRMEWGIRWDFYGL